MRLGFINCVCAFSISLAASTLTAQPAATIVESTPKDNKKSWDGELLVASSEKTLSESRTVFLYSKVKLSRALIQLEGGGWVLTTPIEQTSDGYQIRKSDYPIKIGDKVNIVATDGTSGFAYEFAVNAETEVLVYTRAAFSASTSPLLTPPPPLPTNSAAVNTSVENNGTISSVQASNHPPFKNAYNYPRQIDPQLQARAQSEADILAQYRYAENQKRWRNSGGALGHPVGVPYGYVGGTGCSWPSPTSGWQRVGQNEINTCEPGGPRFTLVAEAVSYNAQDGVWYASRIWRPF